MGLAMARPCAGISAVCFPYPADRLSKNSSGELPNVEYGRATDLYYQCLSAGTRVAYSVGGVNEVLTLWVRCLHGDHAPPHFGSICRGGAVFFAKLLFLNK